MSKANAKKRAFTIVELIIVIAVIGILAAILIPAFSNIIAKANAKSALSDARNTLTSFLTENLEIVDGEIAKSIVIFVYKAKQYYVFGYSNSGPDKGKLMQSAGNPFNYTDLADLINDFNCPDSIVGTDDENQYAFYLYPHDQPSGSGSGIKGGGMDEINANFINLTEKIKGIPETSQVFDGFLIGMIVDAGVHNPGGSGTNPGDTPGGPGGPGGEDPGETQYTITYTPGASEEEVTGMPEPRTYTVNAGGSHEVSPVEPVREGYNFDGWSDGTVTYTGGQIISNITANITLEAQWRIEILPTLTFVAEGATINYAPGFINGQSFQKGTNINEIVTKTTATKEGEEFLGWRDGDTIYTSDHTESILITEDLTLTVVWKTKHTLTFDTDGGTGGPADITFYAGDTIDIPETVPTKEGAVFAGWEYDGFTYVAGGKIINAPDHDITLVAQWTQTWTVSFEIGEAQGTAPASVTVENNGNVTLPQPKGFSRTGYTFDGWTLGSQTYSAGHNYGPVTRDLTFTAEWQAAGGLIYLPGIAPEDSALSDMPEDVLEQGQLTVSSLIPKYIPATATLNNTEAYSFDYWKDGNGNIYYPGDTITVNGTVELTAQWTTGCRVISTVADFERVACFNSAFDMTQKYVLKNNLDLNNKAYEGSLGMIGYGLYDTRFRGVLNGNGYTISRYRYDNVFSHMLGLFDWISTGAEIKYLTMSNCTIQYSSISTSSRYGGVLASFIDGGTFTHITITNSTVNLGTSNGNIYQGILAGCIEGGGEFINVRVENSTYNSSTNSSRSGPFAGRVVNAGSFTDCWIVNCKGTTESSYTTMQLPTDYTYTVIR